LITETVLGVFLALLVAFLWGFANLFYRIGLKTRNYLTSTLIRGSVAVPLLIAATIMFSDLSTFEILTFKLWIILVCSAIMLCVGELLYMDGLKITALSRAVPLSATYPIFTTLFAIILLNEHPNLVTIQGTFVVVVGVSLVVRKNETSLNAKQAPQDEQLEGEILVLIAAVMWGLSITLTGVVLKEPGVAVLPIVSIRLFILLTLVFFLSIIHNRNQLTILNKEVLLERETIVLAIGGIIGYAIGMTAFFFSLDMIGASQAVPLSSIYPMIATVFGIIVLKEKIRIKQWIGIVLIVSGCILVIL